MRCRPLPWMVRKGPSIINANATKCPKRWLNTHRRERSHALNGWPCFPVTTSSAFLLPLSHGFSYRNHPILLCKSRCSWLPWDHGSPWWNSYADAQHGMALLFDYWKVQCRPGSPSLLWRIQPRVSPILIVFEHLLPLQRCVTIGCTEWASEAAACSAACEKATRSRAHALCHSLAGWLLVHRVNRPIAKVGRTPARTWGNASAWSYWMASWRCSPPYLLSSRSIAAW